MLEQLFQKGRQPTQTQMNFAQRFAQNLSQFCFCPLKSGSEKKPLNIPHLTKEGRKDMCVRACTHTVWALPNLSITALVTLRK